jgi:ribosomal protein S18 acetylase RimI-like enzyme
MNQPEQTETLGGPWRAPDADDDVAAIEDALVTHWSLFGRWSQGSLHDDEGIVWFETPIKHLPYNMVMKTRVRPDADADAAVDRVARRFRDRDVPYLWVHRPSDRPSDLGHRLPQHGLDLVETVTGMVLALDAWVPEAPRSRARIAAVDADRDGLADYVELMRTYWSVPESDRDLLEAFNNDWAGDRSPGTRLVAYLDGAPVGKLFMNLLELPERVSIYGVATKPEARGAGIASALMVEALAAAASVGAARCVLHSSAMAVSLYRRMGFVERCAFPVYATGPLFGTHHH